MGYLKVELGRKLLRVEDAIRIREHISSIAQAVRTVGKKVGDSEKNIPLSHQTRFLHRVKV